MHVADILYTRTAALRAVKGGEVNQFRRALEFLAEAVAEIDSPVAIVEGLAAIHHGVRVSTLAIDVVIAAGHLDPFVRQCEERGLMVVKRSAEGWHRLRFHDPEGDVDIEVIPADRKSPRDPAHAPANPSPESLGVEQGLGYATFESWVVMKLVANRAKDRYHLVEALKNAGQEQVAAVVFQLRKLDSTYLKEFERLLRAAEDENQEKW